MWYTFSDKSYVHASCKWWQVVNFVCVYDSRGGVQPITTYKVLCVRLWNLEVLRVVVEEY